MYTISTLNSQIYTSLRLEQKLLLNVNETIHDLNTWNHLPPQFQIPAKKSTLIRNMFIAIVNEQLPKILVSVRGQKMARCNVRESLRRPLCNPGALWPLEAHLWVTVCVSSSETNGSLVVITRRNPLAMLTRERFFLFFSFSSFPRRDDVCTVVPPTWEIQGQPRVLNPSRFDAWQRQMNPPRLFFLRTLLGPLFPFIPAQRHVDLSVREPARRHESNANGKFWLFTIPAQWVARTPAGESRKESLGDSFVWKRSRQRGLLFKTRLSFYSFLRFSWVTLRTVF